MAMPYHPRIESKTLASFLTTRCRNYEMWFANNRPVENAALGYLAKYAEVYGVKVYAFAMEGNHTQAPALFPLANRAAFMRVLNSTIAKAIQRLTANAPDGTIFGRRYSNEFLPGNEDIEEYFFYTVLQPVQDCLVERISDYPFYNCFSDAVNGIERVYKVTMWGEYHQKLRYDPTLKVEDFTTTYKLKYERLPGYEHLSLKEYSKLMHQKLEIRRAAIVNKKRAEGKSFLGRKALLKVVPGTRAKKPKRSKITSHRPRVLSICDDRRAKTKVWYFDKYFAYKSASKRYRAGELDVEFPDGMYPPFRPCKFSP